MEALDSLERDHTSRREWRVSSLEPVRHDLGQYLYQQSQYEHWYGEVFDQVLEAVYRVSQTDEGPVELTKEDKEIISRRDEELTQYLLEAYPI